MYTEYLIKNINVGLFGAGVGCPILNEKAAHNTYIDVFYHLGAFGGLLLAAILIAISEQSRKIAIKRSIMNYSVIICIVIMYFFLSELFYFDPPFHIYLAITVLNTPMNCFDGVKK
jgi:O-antigen ligase